MTAAVTAAPLSARPITHLATVGGSVLVVGATSALARWIADAFAARGHDLVLAGRDGEELDRIGRDLEIRHGISVRECRFDAFDAGAGPALIDYASRIAPTPLEGIVYAAGLLGEHERAARDPGHAEEILAVNLVAAVTVLNAAAAYLEARGRGFLAAIGSVSGDRGRKSNYVYGAAKAGLDTLMEGLRHRLFRSGIAVVTVKPGFLDTRMTFGMPGVALAASPTRAGEVVAESILRRRRVVYVPGFWRYVMLLIRLAPRTLLHRTEL